jgi:DNA-binding LacI/PurR family transcriptional regulator
MVPVLSKSQHLGEQLKQELASEQLLLGQKFYSIPEVSERYSVSPATAYKVVTGLVKDGYLRSHRGKGYFIEKKPGDGKNHRLFKPRVQTKTLVLVNDFDHVQPPAKVLAGIQRACGGAEYRLEIVSVDEAQLVDIALRNDVAGLIHCMDHQFPVVRKIAKPQICIGHWSNPDDGVISFIADAENAALESVRHLCGLGHQRIAFIVGNTNPTIRSSFCGQISAGLRRGYQTYGLQWNDDCLCVDLEREESELIDEFVRTFREKQITAAFVPAWSGTLQLVRRLRQDGLSIPRDLSVVCYGEDPISSHIQPAMTSFDLFIRDIAHQAGQMLIDFDRDGKPLPKTRFVTFPVEMIVRQSTALI